MTAPLHIIDRGSTAVVGVNASPMLTTVDIKPYYCGGDARCFVLGHHRLPDLLAYLDARRLPYRLNAEAAA